MTQTNCNWQFGQSQNEKVGKSGRRDNECRKVPRRARGRSSRGQRRAVSKAATRGQHRLITGATLRAGGRVKNVSQSHSSRLMKERKPINSSAECKQPIGCECLKSFANIKHLFVPFKSPNVLLIYRRYTAGEDKFCQGVKNKYLFSCASI